MKRNLPKDTETFVYHNENPRKISASDCVIRAIAKATEKSWSETYHGLCLVGLDIKDIPNCKKVFELYLKRGGYEMKKQIKDNQGKKITVLQFIKLFESGTYILNLRGHLTTVIDGKIYDTWNCGKQYVGNYWKIKN